MEISYYLMSLLLMFVAWVASLSSQARRIERLSWSTAALNRRVGLLVGHLKLKEGLPDWQKLALDPSSSKLAVIKAYIAETGSSLREAKDAVESWDSQRQAVRQR